MRSDAKLGLALGMLITGFAIAFCFPREGRESAAERFTASFSQEDETDIAFVPIHSLRDKKNFSPATEEDLTVDFAQQNDATSASSPSLTNVADAPDEVRTSSDVSIGALLNSDVHAEPQSDDDFDRTAPVEPAENADQLPVEQMETSASPTRPMMKTYRVKAGDTLTEIAMQTLGSYHRYLDIFEANRDRISSPDDLKLGLELRIPVVDGATRPADREGEIDKQLASDADQPSLEQKQPDDRQAPAQPGGTTTITDRRLELPVNQIHPRGILTHEVQPGETLEQIAVRYFGTVGAVRQIQRANSSLLRGKTGPSAGMVLKLTP